jgi:hypothetical protein
MSKAETESCLHFFQCWVREMIGKNALCSFSASVGKRVGGKL